MAISSQTGCNSRLPGFYELPSGERANVAAKAAGLTPEELKSIHNFGALSSELADTFIENAVGAFSLPLGVATNFRINHRDILIPMAVEESSVIAAASHGAKLARCGGGFVTSSTQPITTGQVQVFLPANLPFDAILQNHKQQLLDYANRGQERLIKRGGGACDMTWYYIAAISCLVINLHVNTCEAMGANIVNTMCEKLAGFMPELFPDCQLGLKILTNLTDRRVARSECLVPFEAFQHRQFTGEEVARRIVAAWEFAWHDVYRATTHNKGVMNGIDPVLIATGNDWRAVEAGAHAFCVQDGVYRPMTTWDIVGGQRLRGRIELPMAVGTVGGVTKLHPTAQTAIKMLGNPTSMELAEIVVSVGLAQNLSALRALATEGIQLGHMSLHQKNRNLLHLQAQMQSSIKH